MNKDKNKNENVLLKILSYPRAILFGLFTVPLTIYWATMVLVGTFFTKNLAWGDWGISRWCRIINWGFNVKTIIEGRENLPAEGCVFVFNHTSYFDITAITERMLKTARFGAKSELFKIPFFGQAMKAVGILPIHRAKRELVFELYKASVERIKQGESFILAGEGGRHRGAYAVGDKFKAGPFIFAMTAQCPIVPLVVIGAREVQARKDLLPMLGKWRRTIKVKILPPVPTVNLNLDDRPALAEKIRQMMVQAHTEG